MQEKVRNLGVTMGMMNDMFRPFDKVIIAGMRGNPDRPDNTLSYRCVLPCLAVCRCHVLNIPIASVNAFKIGSSYFSTHLGSWTSWRRAALEARLLLLER